MIAIRLRNNELVTIPNKLFHGLNNLELLDLSYNKLNELKENVFSGLCDLRYLELNNNLLKNLPDNLLRDCNLNLCLITCSLVCLII